MNTNVLRVLRCVSKTVLQGEERSCMRADMEAAGVATEALIEALKKAKWMLERDYIDPQKMGVIDECRQALHGVGVET